MLAPSYLEAHRYDGAVVQHDRREQLMPCPVQPRDLAIVRDVWQYKFLTAPQLLELFWPNGAAWPGQRRLRKLFDAGYLERFRPLARKGSYPWTYHLAAAGHRLLQRARLIPHAQRYHPRTIYDYGHVLHEIQLNAWVLAYRRAAGNTFRAWHGELDITPSREARNAQVGLDDDASPEGLRDPRPRLIRPDAALELAGDSEDSIVTVLVEYDRTRRIDKNYDKFRRYDAFLCSWWRDSPYADRAAPPTVVFVCQNQQQRQQFITAADHELTGHRWPSAAKQHDYPGRQHMLFAVEHDAHAGRLGAWQLPLLPFRHSQRDPAVRRVELSRPNLGSA